MQFERLPCRGTIECNNIIQEHTFIFFFIYVASHTDSKSNVWPDKGSLIHHLSVSMGWMP